jgi:hypothetical protein
LAHPRCRPEDPLTPEAAPLEGRFGKPWKSAPSTDLGRLRGGRNLHVVRYEDVEAEPDWLKLDRVVRMFARKPNWR